MLFYAFILSAFYILFTLGDYKWPNKWQRKILQILPCILLLFIAIFRFDIGYDYPSYYKMATPLYADELERIEPFSRYIIECAKYFEHPYILFILFGIPTYCIVFFVCGKTRSFQLAFWAYVFLFLFDSFGIIRQALAMSIYLYALLCLREKRFFMYILLCILASFFHISVLAMVPVYFIYHYFSIGIVLFSLIGLTIAFPFVISILLDNNLYAYYLHNSEDFEGGSYTRFFYVGIYLILLFLAYKKGLLIETKRLFTVLLPAFFFPFLFGSHLGGRLSSYFYLFFIFLIPQVLSQCCKKIKMAFMLMLCAYFFAFLYVSQRAGDKSPYTPYKTIFEVDLKHPIFK